MKKEVILSFGFLFLCCSVVLAQEQEMEEESNGILVVSYFKCNFNKMSDVIQMTNEQSAPILNSLVDEGKLQSWGSLRHLWGDEWSFIVYYTAESLGSFETAFDEFISESMEANPDWMDEWSSLCSEHKDNVYSIVNGYPGGEGN